MAIEFKLNVIMAERGMRLKDLAEKLGLTLANVSHLKNGKVKALRLSTLDALCHHLSCEPGDLIRYVPGDVEPTQRHMPAADGAEPETASASITDISLPSDFLD